MMRKKKHWQIHQESIVDRVQLNVTSISMHFSIGFQLSFRLQAIPKKIRGYKIVSLSGERA